MVLAIALLCTAVTLVFTADASYVVGCEPRTYRFNDLAPGAEVLSSPDGLWALQTERHSDGAKRASAILDSAFPPTGDADLGTPGECAGGPGRGYGGRNGMPGANCNSLGNLLVAHRGNLTDLRQCKCRAFMCMNCQPNDDRSGATYTFYFREQVVFEYLVAVDLEGSEALEVKMPGNVTRVVSGLGNNAVQYVPVHSFVAPGMTLILSCTGSCGFAQFSMSICPKEPSESQNADAHSGNTIPVWADATTSTTSTSLPTMSSVPRPIKPSPWPASFNDVRVSLAPIPIDAESPEPSSPIYYSPEPSFELYAPQVSVDAKVEPIPRLTVAASEMTSPVTITLLTESSEPEASMKSSLSSEVPLDAMPIAASYSPEWTIIEASSEPSITLASTPYISLFVSPELMHLETKSPEIALGSSFSSELFVSASTSPELVQLASWFPELNNEASISPEISLDPSTGPKSYLDSLSAEPGIEVSNSPKSALSEATPAASFSPEVPLELSVLSEFVPSVASSPEISSTLELTPIFITSDPPIVELISPEPLLDSLVSIGPSFDTSASIDSTPFVEVSPELATPSLSIEVTPDISATPLILMTNLISPEISVSPEKAMVVSASADTIPEVSISPEIPIDFIAALQASPEINITAPTFPEVLLTSEVAISAEPSDDATITNAMVSLAPVVERSSHEERINSSSDEYIPCEMDDTPIQFNDLPIGFPVHSGYGFRLRTHRLGPAARDDASAVFDSSNPSNTETDLGSPNEGCKVPGPGTGYGGVPGERGENCESLGKLLVAHEGNVEQLRRACAHCSTCALCSPNDSGHGAMFEFTFTVDAVLRRLVVLDVDELPRSLSIKYHNGELYEYAGYGDNGRLNVDLFHKDIPAGGSLTIYCAGSCGIARIELSRCTRTLPLYTPPARKALEARCKPIVEDFDHYSTGSRIARGNNWVLDTSRLDNGGKTRVRDVSAAFNTSSPTAGDVDIGAPNALCESGGPGIGVGGAPMEPGVNCKKLGQALIAHSGNVIKLRKICKNCPNCVKCQPNDHDGGAVFTFTFLRMVRVTAMTFLDLDDAPRSARIITPAGITYVHGLGDNSKQTVSLAAEKISEGASMSVQCVGSCAIVNFEYFPCI